MLPQLFCNLRAIGPTDHMLLVNPLFWWERPVGIGKVAKDYNGTIA